MRDHGHIGKALDEAEALAPARDLRPDATLEWDEQKDETTHPLLPPPHAARNKGSTGGRESPGLGGRAPLRARAYHA